MDCRNGRKFEDAAQDEPPRRSETAIRAMLEQSRRDIAEGRTAPLAAVLDRMRATAERIRHERAKGISS